MEKFSELKEGVDYIFLGKDEDIEIINELSSCSASLRAASLNKWYLESYQMPPALYTEEELSPFKCNCSEGIRQHCDYSFTADN
jgi:hypothetical protein